MEDHSEALSILQKARDALTARLTQRIIESEHEIVEDAEGNSYFSEIETIYEQLGARLAHLNAMLSNLPPTPPQHCSETAASEVIYADLASSPSSTLDVDATGPLTLLALPSPATYDDARVEPMVEVFAGIVMTVKSGDLNGGARLISELFDVKPSLARRGAQAFERQLNRFPDLARRFEQFGASIDATNEYAAATLIGECFEFQPIDALLLVRALKQHNDPGTAE